MCEKHHPGADDCFRPPDVPTLVRCLHCGQEYESFRITWRDNDEREAEVDAIPGFWCCPTPGCDGKGFGFDIFAVDSDCPDERGQWVDDGYDDECEAWELMEPEFDTLLWSDIDDFGPTRVDGLLGDPTPPGFTDPSYKRSEGVDDEDIPF